MRTIIMKTLCFMICTVMLVGLLPTGVVWAASGGADIVFAVDNAKNMQSYDSGADGSWLDAFAGLIEQAPSGSGFGVVAKNGVTSLTSAASATEALYDIPLYYGESNSSMLLSQAVNILDGSSKQKIIVLSTSKWYNELKEQAQQVESQGILVYIIAFEANTAEAQTISDSYEHAIVCNSVNEVSYRMADLYATVSEISPYSSRMMLMSTASTSYNSSFRGGSVGKHNFGFNVTTYKKGATLAALLNMYYLMPSRVSDGYTLSGEQSKKIGSGVTNGLFENGSSASSMLSFWESKAASLLNAPAYTGTSTGITGQISVIDENIKRRFPVLISAGTMDISDTSNEYYLITKSENSGDGYTFYVYDPSSDSNTANTKSASYFNGKYVRVLDTQKYFNSIYATHTVKTTLNGSNATLSLPSGYSGQVKKYVGNNESSLTISNNSVTITVTSGEEFSVAMDVQWNGLLPDIHNATMNFRVILFTDVDNSHWARPYIFTMTNQRVINGRGEGVFAPEDNATIAEYLTMTVRAADVEGHEAWDDATWPTGYMNYAMDPTRKWLSSGTDGSQLISRELAFNLTWKILSSDNCRTPTQLVNYNIGVFTNAVSFADRASVSEYCQESVAELYKNGIVAGYPEGDLRPRYTITRAETAKTLSKCIARFDEEKQISVGAIGGYDVLTQIPLDVTTSDVIGEKGGTAFAFHTDDTGLYPITVTGNVNLTAYEQIGTGSNVRFERVYEKANKAGHQFPILQNKNMIVALSGSAGTSFSVKVGAAQSGNVEPLEKRVFITLYDSPIKRYRDSVENLSATEPVRTANDPRIEHEPNYLWKYNRYEYTENFFKNYLTLIGDKKVAFVISVRDLDFDDRHTEIGQSTTEYLAVPQLTSARNEALKIDVADYMSDIIVKMRNASISLGKGGVIPEIYLTTPHFSHMKISEADLDYNNPALDTIDEARAYFISNYEAVSKGIYSRVISTIKDVGIVESVIAGIYYGREDPDPVYGDNGVFGASDMYTLSYETKKSMAEFVHSKDKKLLWMPYGDLADVGKATNVGVYNGSDGKSHDLFDVVISQPGLFYSDYGTPGNTTSLTRVYDLHQSARQQKIVTGSSGTNPAQSGSTVQGGKFTDTTIGFEMEYDMGFVTGRWHNHRELRNINGADVSVEVWTDVYPKQKNSNFILTKNIYHDLIYNTTTPFGIYAGGPNEQGYTDTVLGIDSGTNTSDPKFGKNDNRHGLINYQTVFATSPEYIEPDWTEDSGDGVKYEDFYTMITQHAGADDTHKFISTYDGKLIYNITKGLLFNTWDSTVNTFLGTNW